MEPLSGMNGPLCQFGAQRSSPEIQLNSPMSLGLKICHGDKQTWPRYEPDLQEDRVCWHCWPEAGKQLVYVYRSLYELSLAAVTDRTFAENIIKVLA